MAPSRDELRTYVLVGALAIAAIVGGGLLLFGRSPPPPVPPPAPPPPIATSVSQTWRYSTTYYKGQIEEDATRFGLTAPSLEEMEAVFPYSDELATPRPLRADGETVTTAHLILRTSIRGAPIGRVGSVMNGLVSFLRIENRTDRPIAYRVSTNVARPRRCLDKPSYIQNALALAPHDAIERTECIYAPDEGLELRRVEVIELPPLAYYYVSELNAQHLALDARLVGGHSVPKGSLCTIVPADVIADAMTRGLATWRDVIDFYGRETCKEYSFFEGYRAPGQPLTTLPVVPPRSTSLR